MENIKPKIFNIFGEKAINESLPLIMKKLESSDFFKFAIPKDYIFLPLFEEKINQTGLLICALEESSDYIEICVKKSDDFNLDTVINLKDKKNFNESIGVLKNIPDSSVRTLLLKDITDDYTYEELEKFFSEAFRILSYGSSFYIEYIGTAVSEYLLKGYIEYAGFINVFPIASAGEYEQGKIKIYSKKTGLIDISKQPKKVLINIDLKQPEKLLESTILIRDLHNKYNNWDLYLVSDDWKFFDENIYLKYCSADSLSENFDYVIYIDDFNPFPVIDYEFKSLNGRKPDLFYSQENLASVRAFLDKHGIAGDDFFLIIDAAFIDIKSRENILEKFKTDFPYIVKIGFKTLVAGEDFNDLTLKDKALLLQLSSFYAGRGFTYFLSDALYIPSYNISSVMVNYKRRHKAESFDVSIVIPAYNNFSYTKQCVFSIFKNHPLLDFEIIIIDNGSTDETKEYFTKFNGLKNFRFISNDENLGFAKASNMGAKLSSSENILFLNNDTVVSKGAIDELYCSVNSGEAKSLKMGAAGPLLLYPDKKIQQAGIMFEERLVPYNAYSGMNISGCGQSDIKNTIYIRSYNALTAACLMLKKETFEAVGGFDEGYINGFEDVDLCLKLREGGYRLIFNPKSIIFHFEEKTAGRKKHDIENINRFMEKWRHKYKRDNYIFAETDNLFIDFNPRNGAIRYIRLSELKSTKNKIDGLLLGKHCGETLTPAADIIKIDKFNLKIDSKKDQIENEKPLVSILMTTCNRPGFFIKAIESALFQTYKNIEIIITDDSTNDETEKIVNSYKKRFKNIYYERNKYTLGQELNVRKCFDLSKGEYVNFLFDDDLFHPQKIEKMMDFFFADPSVAMVASSRQIINSNGEILGNMEGLDYFIKNSAAIAGKDIIRLCLVNTKNYIGEPTTVLFNKKYLKEPFGIFLGRQYINNIDMASWFSILTEGKLGFLLEPLSFFRIHDSQITNSFKARFGGCLDFLHQIYFAIDNGILNNDDFLFVVNLILTMLYGALKQNKNADNLETAIYDDFYLQMNNLKEYVDKIFPVYKKKYFAQLFIDTGKGFNEEESIKIDLDDINEGLRLLEFNLDNYRNIKNLRFDPINQSANIKINKIDMIGSGNYMFPLTNILCNAWLSINSKFYFSDADPLCIIVNKNNKILEHVKKINILIYYDKIGFNALKDVIDLIKNEFNSKFTLRI